MHFTTLVTSIPLAVTLSSASPAPATPSASCTYSCPAQDLIGYLFGSMSNNNGVLICYHPSTPDNPTQFSCEYNSLTGAIISDHDVCLCHDSTVASCSNRRRRQRDVLPRFPAPTGVPIARDTKPEMKRSLPSPDAVEEARACYFPHGRW